jgi:hypothetical protein
MSCFYFKKKQEEVEPGDAFRISFGHKVASCLYLLYFQSSVPDKVQSVKIKQKRSSKYKNEKKMQ